jgi:hypothetical protein
MGMTFMIIPYLIIVSQTYERVHGPASGIREGTAVPRDLYRSRGTVLLDDPVRRTDAIQYHSFSVHRSRKSELF